MKMSKIAYLVQWHTGWVALFLCVSTYVGVVVAMAYLP